MKLNSTRIKCDFPLAGFSASFHRCFCRTRVYHPHLRKRERERETARMKVQEEKRQMESKKRRRKHEGCENCQLGYS